MATTDYDPATRRRLGIDPPLQRSIGNQECPGCSALSARLAKVEREFEALARRFGGVERDVARHVTANHRHVG